MEYFSILVGSSNPSEPCFQQMSCIFTGSKQLDGLRLAFNLAYKFRMKATLFEVFIRIITSLK